MTRLSNGNQVITALANDQRCLETVVGVLRFGGGGFANDILVDF